MFLLERVLDVSEGGGDMLLNRFARFIVSLTIVFTLFGVGTIELNANKPETQGEVQYKKKRCNYDKDSYDSSKDEESTTGDCSGTVPTPEPLSIILFTAGLAGIGFAARRHLRRSENGD